MSTPSQQTIIQTDPTSLISNSTLGNVWPAMPAQPLPDRDARDYALNALRKFFSYLVFQRTNAKNLPPISFQIPKDSIQIYQPDDIKNAPLPGIAFLPGRGVHDTYGLGPPEVVEATAGIAGPNTALVRSGVYNETITVEVWGSKIAERRAIVAGLKSAMRMSDRTSAIRLKVPDYFNQTATFSLSESQYVDGDEVSRNRRRAFLMLDMSICEVFVTNVVNLRSDATYQILDGNINLTLDC